MPVNFFKYFWLRLNKVWFSRIGICVFAFAPAVCLVPSTAGANVNSPIELIVGYPPGGLADQLSRLAAKELSKELQRPIAVKNLSGGSGIRAAREVLQSGNEQANLFIADSSLVIANLNASTSSPDPLVFLPIGTFGITPFALVVPAKSNVNSVAELISYMKANPASANYGSPGNFTMHQLGGQMLLQRAEIKAQNISYQGGGPMLLDLLSGRLTFGIVSVQLADQYARNGQLRVLAVTGSKRASILPDTPTLSETYPGLTAVSVGYLLAAPKMSTETLELIAKAWSKIIRQNSMAVQLEALGIEGPALDASGTKKLMDNEKRYLKSVIIQDN